jgi:hypothetical protein
MQLAHMKATFAVVWISALCAAGVLAGVTSLSSWAVLAVCAVLPPLAVMLFWKEPPQSLSESIQKALR